MRKLQRMRRKSETVTWRKQTKWKIQNRPPASSRARSRQLIHQNTVFEHFKKECVATLLEMLISPWPCGPMDKASDYESGDSRFESWQGRTIAGCSTAASNPHVHIRCRQHRSRKVHTCVRAHHKRNSADGAEQDFLDFFSTAHRPNG